LNAAPPERHSSQKNMVVLKVVAAATTRTLSQFDQCAVAILADIVFPVKVAAIAPLERAGGMQHRWDALATVVATFTALGTARIA
jgi:hypothetical protein